MKVTWPSGFIVPYCCGSYNVSVARACPSKVGTVQNTILEYENKKLVEVMP